MMVWSSVVTVQAQNAIVRENNLPGNPSTEWDITGAGDLTLQGFATDISVNKGQTINFKINITGANKNYAIRVYRIGYYNGNGARLVANLGTFAGVTQPNPITNTALGLVDCGNWAVSASWKVPDTLVSGVYIAKLIRQDNGGASHIIFIVRDDAATADILFKTSDATWQAYNPYGGSSLYVGNTAFGNGHAVKVSYNRPFYTRNGGGGGSANVDWLFNAEYPMIRWLERNGYDLAYATDVDMERNTTPITPAKHRVLLSVGHDEYWSLAERNRFEAARNAGVHLAFFSGNEVYWKTRWENSIDGSNTPHRTLVCYKEGSQGENVCNSECDPSSSWTGLWRSGCGATATDACKPENALTGQVSWLEYTGSIVVPYEYKDFHFWRNTAVATLAAGQSVTLPAGTLGYELDFEQPAYSSSNPAGRITLSKTTFNGNTHKLSLYRHSSGALVFGAGTVQWSWGLDDKHDRGSSVQSPVMQQATVNLFADMGVQPGNLQSDLSAAAPSTDVTAPVSIISFPTNGKSLEMNVPVTISGTATDNKLLAGVEVSFDGGITWNLANGTTNWSYTWTPTSLGTFTIKVRGFDDNGNLEIPGSAPTYDAITVTITPQTCPCTIWASSIVPISPYENDPSAVELGVRFRPVVDGFITGVRFYKSLLNKGTHIGNLWTNTGVNLARATFTDETSSGWQEVKFSNPVAVTAGTTYVASYHTDSGYYYSDTSYFLNSAKVTPYLVALQSGSDGPNGVYTYSPSTTFPNNTYKAANYYVDVVFTDKSIKDTLAPRIINIDPLSGATGIDTNAVITASFSEALDPATLNTRTIQLRGQNNTSVPFTFQYNASNRIIIITPQASLGYGNTYTVKWSGGSASEVIRDLSGNPLPADSLITFTTKSAPLMNPAQGLGGPILVVSSSANAFSRYTVEILRAQGLNSFAVADIASVNATLLSKYEVVILGEMSLSAAQISDLTNWVNAGGTLVAFKPVAGLNSLLGITAAGGTLSEGYLLVNNNTEAGKGIVNKTIQFHGTANLYALNGATAVATLYSSATQATANPAVTWRQVGANGGVAIAFAYDLPKSIVYTRQGNPAWSGQERDNQPGPIRSNDLFYPSWVDFSRITIPQADEQQHLLTNLIHYAHLSSYPMPRIWFLPKGLKAAVVMTGDDHASAGASTMFRFNRYKDQSPANNASAVENWDAVRATSYIFPGTAISNYEYLVSQQEGFEVALHLNTGCQNFTPASWSTSWNDQYNSLKVQLPSLNNIQTHRTHCVAWSDYTTQARKQAELGVRLDVNYYYWPAAWIQDRPGLFTGSGMPMRFSDSAGALIDCYQVPSQLTDESGQDLRLHITALLDSALGSAGYYGVFCANMHTDNSHPTSLSGSDAIVAEALARGVPVVSARQMLNWLDARNNSTFANLSWSGSKLSFNIIAASGSRNMKGMLPLYSRDSVLSRITYEGTPVPFTTEQVKGVVYAFFDATKGNGTYIASYTTPAAPVITNVKIYPEMNGTARVEWSTDIYSGSRVDYGLSATSLSQNVANTDKVTRHSVILKGLTQGTLYYLRVVAAEASGKTGTYPVPTAVPISFLMPAAACASDQSFANFSLGTVDSSTTVSTDNLGQIALKPRLQDEFNLTALNTTIWSSQLYQFGGGNKGTLTFSSGQVVLNGSRIISRTLFGPGTAIEFVATFTAGTSQYIGFSSRTNFTQSPWVAIGQGATADGNLYIRTSDTAFVNLGPNLLGSPHRFKIRWNAGTNNFNFFVDGIEVSTPNITLAVSASMYIHASDNNNTTGSLAVDWLKVYPFAPSGTFTSRVFDHAINADWRRITWNADTPGGTAIVLRGRSGNTPVPDSTWLPYAILINGGNVDQNGRYFQYQATLSTTNTMATPLLSQVYVGCSDLNSAVTITTEPVSQLTCPGQTARFVSKASSPTTALIQWQQFEKVTGWTDIPEANRDTLLVLATNENKGKQYRAIWTNASAADTSLAATLDFSQVAATLVTKQDIQCWGRSNGSLTVSGNSGRAPYQYSINNGLTYQDSGTFTGLSPNSYNILIRDANGCSGTTSVVLTEPSPLDLILSSKINVSCNGGKTGTLLVTGFGGVSPYQYSINAGSFLSSGSFNGLTAGDYVVAVKDTNGCTQSKTFVITEPLALSTTVAEQVNVDCNGNANGSVRITSAGGTLPYQYSLNGAAFQSSGQFSGLQANNYVITVKDGQGCTVDQNVTVIQPVVLGIQVSAQTNIKCNGDNNGTVSLTGTGGTTPYQYSFDGGALQSSGSFTGLVAGSYPIAIKDANGCMTSQTVQVKQPAALSVASQVKTDLSCFGSANGTISLSASGGVQPYQYNLNGGQFQAAGNFTGLSAATYTVNIKDANGCALSREVTVTQPAALNPSVNNQTNVDCNGNATGSFTISATGGTLPYQYSLNSGAYQASASYTGLTARSYVVSIKDANGCITDQPVTITQPVVLGSSLVSQTNIACNGNSTGAVSISGTGGITPYQYSFDGGPLQGSGSFTGLLAGSYPIAIKDANGCMTTQTVRITQPSALSVASQVKTDVSCFGSANGTISLSAAGGVQPYQYNLDGGQFQAASNFAGLSAASYTVNIKDANGCALSREVTVTQPASLNPSVNNQTNVDCNGNATGSFTITATGGTLPYQYSLNSGAYQASASYTGLTARSYVVNIRDANGCNTDQSVVITQPAVLQASVLSQTNIACNGSSTGAVSISGTGGTTPYQYSFDGGALQGSGSFTGLVAGSYPISIKDANGCMTSQTVQVTQPAALSVASQVKTDVNCFGSANGAISLSAAGGVQPYQYNLNGGQFQAAGNFTGLSAASYTVSIKDANGCALTREVTVTQPTALNPSVNNQTNVDCFGNATGSFTIAATGGTLPYQYSLNGGTFQGSASYTGLTAKSYLVTVKDANGCVTDQPVTITQPAVLGASLLSQTNIVCYGNNTGVVEISGTGGTAPYAYSFDGGTLRSSGLFTSLIAGSYPVSIRDANGCQTSKTVTITQPAALFAANLSKIDVNCNGAADGSIHITAAGGTQPYAYNLNGGAYQSAGTFTGLSAAAYTVSVKDGNGCVLTQPVTVVQPAALAAAVNSRTDVDCFGNSTGAVSISGAGGIQPYSYSVNGNSYQSSGSFSGLSSGSYTIRVKDNNGCITSASVVVSQPELLVPVLDARKDVDCFGNNSGSVSWSGTGGTLPYQFSLNNGSYLNSGTYNSLSAGRYTLAIRDARGCVATQLVDIKEPGQLVASTASKIAVNCYGGASGALSITGTGGIAPYQYRIDNQDFQPQNTFTGLTANNYSITLRDANGCLATLAETISQPSQLVPALVSKTAVKCFGETGGALTVSATGGTLPYQFQVNEGLLQSSGSFTGLPAGQYTVKVIDANNCISDFVQTVQQPAAIAITVTLQPLACLENTDGSFRVSGSGGTAPLRYSFDNGQSFTNVLERTGLASGNYALRIVDGNNCVKDTLVHMDVNRYVWKGTVSVDWHDPRNWSSGRIPESSAHIIIPPGTPFECVLSEADVTVASIQLRDNAPLRILNNRTISIKGKCQILPAD